MSVIFINPYRFGATYDADAAAYFAAVEAADGQALETAVKDAIDAFVRGCKADGIWSAIKASCILAGARTLAGALVPLVGAAPTQVGINLYDRKTGAKGAGTANSYVDTKYLFGSGMTSDSHGSAWVSDLASSQGAITFGNHDGNGFGAYPFNSSSLICSAHGTAVQINGNSIGTITGLIGLSRNTSSTFQYIAGPEFTGIASAATATPRNFAMRLFAGDPAFGGGYPSTARIAFYSFGNSINLALLNSRVTDLINAIGAAF